MSKIVLISCVSQKLGYRAKVKDLYISTLFRGNMTFAQKLAPDAIYILSAKYGLLDLETEIDPYNLTLNNMPSPERRAWANRVLKQLSQVADLRNDHFIFLAGMKYRENLLPYIASYEVPMEGLSIGRQLQFLSNQGAQGKIVRSSPAIDQIMTGFDTSKTHGKYSPLTTYLRSIPANNQIVFMSFSQIEQLLNDQLPASAKKYRPWWANEMQGSHSQARSWLDAGWKVQYVDFHRKAVRFVRR